MEERIGEMPHIEQAHDAAALTKAVTRAADQLDIPRSVLAQVLGLSAATIPRLYAGSCLLSPDHQEWDLALLFVRVFRSLDAIVGEQGSARGWLSSNNQGLNGRPIEIISTAQGLARVADYLEAARNH